jgi:hypothetical protein
MGMLASTPMGQGGIVKTPDWKRLLGRLEDGDWHSSAELYRMNMIVHSRMADLRKMGHTIEKRITGHGPHHIQYRLVKP